AHKNIMLNAALQSLEVLVGDWVMVLSNTSFLSDPTDKLKGYASFEFIENGGFLIMRQGSTFPGPAAASWLIGRDDAIEDYTVLYFDSRGISRKYEMSFCHGKWKMWRSSPRFWQRFEGEFNKNANKITAFWEKSVDGKNWAHDFDVEFTRIHG
ncbi:MAG TPA: hypothetical protein VKR53_11910, partial [Puia sp.]|nr:hypothetical protein [Puia sp.]